MILKFKTYRTSKQELVQKLAPMGRREFSNLINPIVAEHRSVDLKLAKQKQYLQSNEVVAFLNHIGESVTDYGRVLVLNTSKMDRKTLRRNYLKMSEKEFSITLNRIVFENRKMDRSMRKAVRYLRPGEVMAFLETIGECANNLTALVNVRHLENDGCEIY